MSWTYRQSTGDMLSPDGQVIGHGYSGDGEGFNCPDKQDVHGVGPIPRGVWRMVGLRLESTHGPYAITLEPSLTTNTFGRSGFLVHGDSISHPGHASAGCIIQGRAVREEMWLSDDHDIEVTL